ncbi:transcriptional regulator [Leptolyngbya sp. Heron Island J]|uniref:helix-turn-helix domain-containing protein n=1 Tax=Leptolyngbya sp. Heron Island J TaxID=1385935 RepID=UPI0003B9BF26|nr:ImmA/IrrE family metallo-endopeptidase [Leptolyngbya sp. Heron Island J]ESA38499.1 transcriptional regulator [Leptolyngbya sp. Heron Island J]
MLLENISGFNGVNLIEAREARGLTGKEFGKLLGVTRQTISNYENNKRKPSLQTLEKISEKLNFPYSFFLNSSTENSEIVAPIFYRSMSGATKNARRKAEIKFNWLVKLVLYLSVFVETPEVNFPDFDLPSDPNHISDEEIERIAIEVRRFWGLGDGPISNFLWLLENNGGIVVRRSLEAKKLDAFSHWRDGVPYIVITNDKLSCARARFSAAHELGHLILHRNVPQICLNKPEYFKLIEHQANRFAAAIQMPSTAFYKEVKRINLEAFRFLKQRWKLSIAMFITRAEDLGCSDSKKALSLWKSYSRNGWKTFEPLDDDLPLEEPKLIKNTADVLLTEKVISKQQILDQMDLFHLDVEDCAGLPENYLNPRLGEVLDLKIKLRSRDKNKKELTERHSGDVLIFPHPEKLEN